MTTDVPTSGENWKAINKRSPLLVLAAIQFTTIVDFLIVMPLGPQYRVFAITPGQFGLIISAYAISAGSTWHPSIRSSICRPFVTHQRYSKCLVSREPISQLAAQPRDHDGSSSAARKMLVHRLARCGYPEFRDLLPANVAG